ncbi:MAG: HPF/RaiA family ribosome-associated protein [Reyranellaceae bacterium]
MQIQVNTDDNIRGDESLSEFVEAEVTKAIGRFSRRITRIEVHLGDENAAKHGAQDKRCLIEVRPAGRDPIAVTEHADTVRVALAGAIRKLRNILDSSLGRETDHKGAPSIRQFAPD